MQLLRCDFKVADDRCTPLHVLVLHSYYTREADEARTRAHLPKQADTSFGQRASSLCSLCYTRASRRLEIERRREVERLENDVRDAKRAAEEQQRRLKPEACSRPNRPAHSLGSRSDMNISIPRALNDCIKWEDETVLKVDQQQERSEQERRKHASAREWLEPKDAEGQEPVTFQERMREQS